MTQINENPGIILSKIKTQLKKGVKNRHHGFHTPVFSNICENNSISSRIVVLRKFDPYRNMLNFHTDFRSKKILNITKKPETFFVFYDHKDKIQLRINTYSTIHYKNNTTRNAWKKTNLSSRKCYLAKKAPSSYSNFPDDSIPSHLVGIDPKKKESEEGYTNFVLVENEIKNVDWLQLSSLGHRRLIIFLDKKNIEYQWIIP